MLTTRKVTSLKRLEREKKKKRLKKKKKRHEISIKLWKQNYKINNFNNIKRNKPF